MSPVPKGSCPLCVAGKTHVLNKEERKEFERDDGSPRVIPSPLYSIDYDTDRDKHSTHQVHVPRSFYHERKRYGIGQLNECENCGAVTERVP